MRRISTFAAGAAFVMLLAACGSTAPLADRLKNSPPGTGFGEGLGSTPGLGSGATQGPSGSGALGTPTAGGFGGTIPIGGGSQSVTGITATTIYVGTGYQTDQGTGNGAVFGANEFDSGDARNYYKVVLAEINSHGGIAGRKVVPVYAQFSTTSSSTVEEQTQNACEIWTHGQHPVFAILDSGRPVVQECAKKAGILEFGETSGSVTETFRRYPNYVEISGLNLVRQGPVTVDGLAREGYFEPGSRIGIVSWDDPNHRVGVKDGWVPALKRRGLSLATEPSFVHVPQDFQDLGATSADVSSAVLRYHTHNISHVLILDGTAGLCLGGCLTTLFLREADGQGYFPRYGFNDDNLPKTGSEGNAAEGSPPLYPHSQLRRSVAVLWTDIDADADTGIKPNAARERCYALMKKAGLTLDNDNARATALAVCGELWFMQTVVAGIPGRLNVGSFMASVNRLGYSLNDPLVYGTFFSASQHDGVAAARNARWDAGCPCYRYTTGVYRV